MSRAPELTGFAFFGGFWGTWGASVPALREQAGLTDGQLGTALLCVAAGALPAMLVSGRLVDRWGGRAAAGMVLALGLSGVLSAVAGRSLLSLSVALLLLGAASGATDVAINAAAGSAQQVTGRPVISRAHALFSASVVASSLLTGLLTWLGAPLVAPFVVLAVASPPAARVLSRSATRHAAHRGPAPDPDPDPERGAGVASSAVLVLGVLAGLGFAVENAHQSWSAVYLVDVLGAGPALASSGPAVFACTVAVTRFATAGLSVRRPAAVLTTGAAIAASGTALVSVAGSVTLALTGLALAAAGTAVLFPTLLSALSASVTERSRGRATARMTAVAYLGFLAGPVYVGAWSSQAGLPGAMLALAGLALLLLVAVRPGLRSALCESARITAASSKRPG